MCFSASVSPDIINIDHKTQSEIFFVCVCVLFCVQKALDDKFAAVEEKENEIHLLHLSLREKERDVERLNNLLSHNEETINVRECVCVSKREFTLVNDAFCHMIGFQTFLKI